MKAEGWAFGRRKLLTLDLSDGCQGGEGTRGSENAEAWFVPAALAGEPSWGLSLIFKPCLLPACTFVLARPSLGRHGGHLYLAAGKTLTSWDGSWEWLASLGVLGDECEGGHFQTLAL